jgi:5'-phosphate synthase pdxT subunit
MKIGVLALQGDFHAHAAAFDGQNTGGAEVREVRRCSELQGLDGLVLPGGESTTLLNLMQDEPWFEVLRRFHSQGGALFGTCAGAILLSREVLNPSQPSLGLLDAVIERNGFGRQVDSFEARIEVPAMNGDGRSDGRIEAVFIRAPRFRSVGPDVDILARLDRGSGEPVLVRQGRILAATFHPEIAGDGRLHRFFGRFATE